MQNAFGSSFQYQGDTELDLYRVGITELEETQPPADTKQLPHYHILGQNWNPTPVSPKKINPKENKLENTETS